MHRAQRAPNKLVQQRMMDKQKEFHQSKIKNTKPGVITSYGSSFLDTVKPNKSKKNQMEEERFTEIERENRILYEKMMSIYKKFTPIENTIGVMKSAQTSQALYMSRQKKMKKIHVDNQQLLKRLQDLGSSYDINTWQEQRKFHEKQLQKLCEYPLVSSQSKKRIEDSLDGRSSQALSTLYTTASKFKKTMIHQRQRVSIATALDVQENYNGGLLPTINDARARFRSLDPPELTNDLTNSSSFVNDSNENETVFEGSTLDERKLVRQMKKIKPLQVSGPHLIEQERSVLWRQNQFIGQDRDESLIEISKSKNKFYIVTYNLGTYRYQVIELFRFKARKLMFACDQSFQKLIKLLEYKFGKLMIKDFDQLINGGDTNSSTTGSIIKSYDRSILDSRQKMIRIKKKKVKMNSSLDYKKITISSNRPSVHDGNMYDVISPAKGMTATKNRWVNQHQKELLESSNQEFTQIDLKKVQKDEMLQIKVQQHDDFELIEFSDSPKGITQYIKVEQEEAKDPNEKKTSRNEQHQINLTSVKEEQEQDYSQSFFYQNDEVQKPQSFAMNHNDSQLEFPAASEVSFHVGSFEGLPGQ